jgi:hypothetical protein
MVFVSQIPSGKMHSEETVESSRNFCENFINFQQEINFQYIFLKIVQ